MRGAECWTDHRLVRATFQLRVRKVVRKQKPRRRLDVKACQNPEKADTLCELIHEKLLLEEEVDSSTPRDRQSLTAESEALSNVLLEAASDSLVPENIKTGSMTIALIFTSC